jgi:hypothetical protein
MSRTLVLVLKICFQRIPITRRDFCGIRWSRLSPSAQNTINIAAISAEIDPLLKALKLWHCFDFEFHSPRMHVPATSLDAQIHSETDIQHEVTGRKIARNKLLA